jgi:hypothetical protein
VTTHREGGDALIHLRVPAALKRRWVRESRAAGQRLTDWIIDRMEAPVQILTLIVPDGLSFADLKLARDPATGDVDFDAGVVERIAVASGLPADYFLTQPEDVLGGVLTQWYRAHLAAGGAPDPVQEELIAEAQLEDERGSGFSYQPGRA